MKFIFDNFLKNSNILESGMSAIPQENFVQFFNEINPYLETNGKVKRVEIELARSLSTEITVTYYFFIKNSADFIRFTAKDIAFQTKRCDHDEILAKWIEFLKNNLGDELYKKMRAYSTKIEISDADRGIANMIRRLQQNKAKLAQDERYLQDSQNEQAKKKAQFETEFADILDENNGILGL